MPETGRAVQALNVFVVAAVAIPIALFAALAVYTRGERLDRATLEIAHTVSILEEHARRVFEAQALIIDRVDERIAGMGWDEIRASRELHEFLHDVAEASPHVDGLWLIPPHGRTANSADFFPMPDADTTGRDYFRALQAEDQLYFGEMILGLTKRTLNFNVSRRRSPRDGFNGIILVTASLDYFTDFWSRVSSYEAPVAALIREDGEMLARFPIRAGLPDRLPPDSPLLLAMARSDLGVYLADSTLDSERRIYGYSRIGDTPLFVGFGVDVEEALAPWRQGLIWRGAAAALASALLAVSAAVALRRSRRLGETLARWRGTAEALSAEVERRVRAEDVAAERARLLAEIRLARDERKAVLEAMVEGVAAYDAQGAPVFGNDAARRMLDLPPEAAPDLGALAGAGRMRRLDGRPVAPDETPQARLLRGEPIDPVEVRLGFDDDREVVCRFSGAPIRDAEGALTGCVVTFVDVSDAKAAEERRNLLMAELDHRVRNMLATITAMIRISARHAPDKEALIESLTGRVSAMTRTHGLITRSGWRGAGLRQILHDEVAPYEAGRRVALSGPENVVLAPKEAVDLALVVHELATNAAKHGAWSTETGRVEIAWEVETEPVVRLVWRERGGRPVTAPRRVGFGSALIRAAGAEVDHRFEPEGVVCELRMPLRRAGAGEPLASAGPTLASPPPPPPAALDGLQVLVVEDEPAVRLEIETILAEAGVRVIGPAADLAAARALLAEHAPDAALLDVNLSGENVSPLAEALVGRGVPVAFSTGYRDLDLLAPGLRGLPRLQKPFRPADLLRCVAAMAPLRRAG